MTWPPVVTVLKYLGQAVSGPAFATRAATAATLSTAQALLSMVGSPWVDDIKRLKESLILKNESAATAASADAQKRVAEAAEASQRANLHKRRDRLARIEHERQRAEADKVQAEAYKIVADAEATRVDAETRRLTAMAEAQARLIEALSKLKQEGGNFAISEENLNRLLSLPAPTSVLPKPPPDAATAGEGDQAEIEGGLI